jgi:hypothetical protein
MEHQELVAFRIAEICAVRAFTVFALRARCAFVRAAFCQCDRKDFVDLGAGPSLEGDHPIADGSRLAVERLDDAELGNTVTLVYRTSRLEESAPDAEHGEQLVVECPCGVQIIRTNVAWPDRPRSFSGCTTFSLIFVTAFMSLLHSGSGLDRGLSVASCSGCESRKI